MTNPRPAITRRPLAFWTACAMALIVVSASVALYLATYLAGLID